MKKIVGAVAAITVLTGASAFAASFDPATNKNVVGYYTFNEEIEDNEVTDHSSNGVDVETGCIDGSKLVEGLDGNALYFNGENEYIQVDPAALSGKGFTFAAWIKADQWTTWARIFDFGDQHTDVFFGVDGRTAGTLVLREESSAIQINAPLPRLKEWTHVATTFGNGKFAIYINGKIAAQGACPVTPSQVADTASGLYIGRSNWSDPFFKGAMDEVVLADKVLSSKEIKELYTPLSKAAAPVVKKAVKADPFNLSADESVVGFYNFDQAFADGEHEVVNNVSGGENIYTGSLDKSVLTKGKNGKALQMKNGEYIDLNEDAFEGDGITVAMWINPSSWTGWARIFDFGNQVQDAWLGMDGASGMLRLDVIGNGNATLVAELPQIGKWTHVAVTIGNGTARLYVNGVLEAENASNVTPADIVSEYLGLYIGRSNWGSDPFFEGSLDELLVAKRAFSEEEIASVYTGVNLK